MRARSSTRPANRSSDELHPDRSERLGRLSENGQEWVDSGSLPEVIEAAKRQVTWDREAPFARGFGNADSCNVVDGEDGRRRLPETE